MFTRKDLLKLLLKNAPKKTAEENYHGIYRKVQAERGYFETPKGAQRNLQDNLKHFFRKRFVDKIEVGKLIRSIKNKISWDDFGVDPEKVVDEFVDRYKTEDQIREYLQPAILERTGKKPFFLGDDEVDHIFFSNKSLNKDDDTIYKKYEEELLKIIPSLILERFEHYRKHRRTYKERGKIPERQTEKTPEPLTISIGESEANAKKKHDWEKRHAPEHPRADKDGNVSLLNEVAGHIKEIAKNKEQYEAYWLIFDKNLLGLNASDIAKINKQIKEYKQQIGETDDTELKSGLNENIEELEKSKEDKVMTISAIAEVLGMTTDSERKNVNNWKKTLIKELATFLEEKPELTEEIEGHQMDVPAYHTVLSNPANSKDFKKYLDEQHASGSLRPKWPTEKGEKEESGDTRKLKEITKLHKIINLLIKGKTKSQIAKELKGVSVDDADNILDRYFKIWFEKWYRTNQEKIVKACYRIRRALMYIKTAELIESNLPYALVAKKVEPEKKEPEKKKKRVETTPVEALEAKKEVLLEEWRKEPDAAKREKLEKDIASIEKKIEKVRPTDPEGIDKWYLEQVEKALKQRRGIKALIYYTSPYKVKIGEKERTAIGVKDSTKEVSLEEAEKEFKWVKYDVELAIERTWKNTQKSIEYDYSQKTSPDGDFIGEGKSTLKIDGRQVKDSEELKKKVDSFVEKEMIPEGMSPVMLSVGRGKDLDAPKNVLFGSKYFNTLTPGDEPILGTDAFIKEYAGIYKIDPAEKARVQEVERVKTKVIAPEKKKKLELNLKKLKEEYEQMKPSKRKERLRVIIEDNEKWLKGKLDTKDVTKLDEATKEWLQHRRGQEMIEHLETEFRRIPHLNLAQITKMNDALSIQLKKLPAITSIEYMDSIAEDLSGTILSRYEQRKGENRRKLKEEKAKLAPLERAPAEKRDQAKIDRIEKEIKNREDFIEDDEKFIEQIEEITKKFKDKIAEMEQGEKQAYYLPRHLITVSDYIRDFSAGIFEERGTITKEWARAEDELKDLKQRLIKQERDLQEITVSVDPSLEQEYEKGEEAEEQTKRREREMDSEELSRKFQKGFETSLGDAEKKKKTVEEKLKTKIEAVERQGLEKDLTEAERSIAFNKKLLTALKVSPKTSERVESILKEIETHKKDLEDVSDKTQETDDAAQKEKLTKERGTHEEDIKNLKEEKKKFLSEYKKSLDKIKDIGIEMPKQKEEKEVKTTQERQKAQEKLIEKTKKEIKKKEQKIEEMSTQHKEFKVPTFPETDSGKVDDLLDLLDDLKIKVRKTNLRAFVESSSFLELAHSIQTALRNERDERLKKFVKDRKPNKAGKATYLKELEKIRSDKLEKARKLMEEFPADVKKRYENFKKSLLKDKKKGQENFEEWEKNRKTELNPEALVKKINVLLAEPKEAEGAPERQKGVNVIPAPVAKITEGNLNRAKNSLGHFMDLFNKESLRQVKLPEAEEERLTTALKKITTEYKKLQEDMSDIIKIEGEKGVEGANIRKMLTGAQSNLAKIRGAFLSAEKVPAVVFADSFKNIIQDFSEIYNYLANTLDFQKAAAPTYTYAGTEGKPYDPDKEKKEVKILTIEEAAEKAESTRAAIEKELENELMTFPIKAVSQIQGSVKKLKDLFKKFKSFYMGVRPEKEYARSASYEDFKKLSSIPYNIDVPYKVAFPYTLVIGKVPYIFPDNVAHEYTEAVKTVKNVKRLFPGEHKKHKIDLGKEAGLELKHIKDGILGAYDEEDELEAAAAKKGIGFQDAKADVKLIKDATAKQAFSQFILKWREITRNILARMPFRLNEKNPLETSFKSKDYPNMGAYVMKMLPNLFHQEIPEEVWKDPAIRLDDDEVKRRKRITEFIEKAFTKKEVKFDKPDPEDKGKKQEEHKDLKQKIEAIKERMKDKVLRLKEINKKLTPKEARVPYGLVESAKKPSMEEEKATLTEEIGKAQKEIDEISNQMRELKAPKKKREVSDESSESMKEKTQDQINKIREQIKDKDGPEVEKGKAKIKELQGLIGPPKAKEPEKNKLYEGFEDQVKEEFALSGPAKGPKGKNRAKPVKVNPPDNTLEAMKDDLKRLFKKHKGDPKQLVAEWLNLFTGAVMKGTENLGENEYIDPEDVVLALVGWAKRMKNFFPMLSVGVLGQSFFKTSEEGKFKRDPKPYKKVKKDIGAVDIEIDNLEQAKKFESLVETIFKELNFYVKPDTVMPPASLQNLRRIPQFMPKEFYDAVDSFKGEAEKKEGPEKIKGLPPEEVERRKERTEKFESEEAEKEKFRKLRKENPEKAKTMVDPDDPKSWEAFKKQQRGPYERPEPKTVSPEEMKKQKEKLKFDQRNVQKAPPAERKKELERRQKERTHKGSSAQSLAFKLAQKYAYADIQAIDSLGQKDLDAIMFF